MEHGFTFAINNTKMLSRQINTIHFPTSITGKTYVSISDGCHCKQSVQCYCIKASVSPKYTPQKQLK